MGHNKQIKILNRELRKYYLDNNIEPTHKYCSDCNEKKQITEFFKKKSWSLFGVATICKCCKYIRDNEYLSVPENKKHRKEYNAEYFVTNKPKLKQNNKNYREENKEAIKIKDKARRQKNRHKKNEKVNKLYATDEDFRTKKLMRGRLWNVMNGKKNKKACEYGIDWAACIAHLGPRPDNINFYHIDHIVPCSCFDFTNPSHPAICFHPTNLRWALADENLAKNDTIFPELIEQYNLHWIVESLNLNIDEWNSKL